jgi:hypothetical protein
MYFRLVRADCGWKNAERTASFAALPRAFSGSRTAPEGARFVYTLSILL